MKKLILLSTVAILCLNITAQAAERRQINPEAKQFKYSTTIEKERPELNEETKRLIAEYRKNPTETNYNALRKQAEINYDKVVERKKAKLAELKRTARDASKGLLYAVVRHYMIVLKNGYIPSEFLTLEK